MKIIITEEQKKKLFIPRKIDERREQLKKQLIDSTKNMLSQLKIEKIVNHARIDDYEDDIDGEFIEDSYSEVIIGGKNYYGMPKVNESEEEIINYWEDILAIYINSILPQPNYESVQDNKPNIIGRMFRVDVTPKNINISFTYKEVKYEDRKGNESITL